MISLKINVALVFAVAFIAATSGTSIAGKPHSLPSILPEPTKPITVEPITSPNNSSNSTTTQIPTTTPSVSTTSSTVAPNTTTTTQASTTSSTVSPNITTTTSTTTITPTTSSTTISPTTANPNVTTTVPPSPSPEPTPGRSWDGPSFLGGMVLAFGIVAVGFVGYRFFYLRGGAYHTL